MRFSKYINSVSYRTLGAVTIAIGLGILILAFINPPFLLQTALGLIGLGFISLGLIWIKHCLKDDSYEKRFNQLISKLDEIHEELHKGKEAEKRGATIAEIISAGLKYYVDQKNKPEKEQ